MGLTVPADADVRRLTDVQLVHRTNAALAAREAQADGPPSRLLALPLRHGVWRRLTVLALDLRLTSEGAWLAATFASPARLARWAEASDARMARHVADIAAVMFLDEAARRVEARRRSADAREPRLQRG